MIFVDFRWELPNQEHSVLASTANELRRDKYTPINPEKLKAAAEGLQYGRFYIFSCYARVLSIWYLFCFLMFIVLNAWLVSIM